jgi:hypothetical protein
MFNRVLSFFSPTHDVRLPNVDLSRNATFSISVFARFNALRRPRHFFILYTQYNDLLRLFIKCIRGKCIRLAYTNRGSRTNFVIVETQPPCNMKDNRWNYLVITANRATHDHAIFINGLRHKLNTRSNYFTDMRVYHTYIGRGSVTGSIELQGQMSSLMLFPFILKEEQVLYLQKKGRVTYSKIPWYLGSNSQKENVISLVLST